MMRQATNFLHGVWSEVDLKDLQEQRTKVGAKSANVRTDVSDFDPLRRKLQLQS